MSFQRGAKLVQNALAVNAKRSNAVDEGMRMVEEIQKAQNENLRLKAEINELSRTLASESMPEAERKEIYELKNRLNDKGSLEAKIALHLAREKEEKKIQGDFDCWQQNSSDPTMTVGPGPCKEDNAAYWGIRMKDVCRFRKDIREDLRNYCDKHKFFFWESSSTCHVCEEQTCDCQHLNAKPKGKHESNSSKQYKLEANMHLVVSRHIKPQTEACGKSYAIMTALEKYNKPQLVTAFVSHTWSELFEHFVDTLEMALDSSEVVFICSFAINQNKSIADSLHGELLDVPFAKALRHARKIVLVADKDLSLTRRLWCCFELQLATLWRIPTFLWPHITADFCSKIAVKTAEATATTKDDRDKLQEFIIKQGGFDKLDSLLHEHINDRAKIFRAAVTDVTSRVKDDCMRWPSLLRQSVFEMERKHARSTNNHANRLQPDDCEDHRYSEVSGTLFYPPMVSLEFDKVLQRSVFRINELCWFKCIGVLALPPGRWNVGFVVQVSHDIRFDADLDLTLNGEKMRQWCPNSVNERGTWFFLDVMRDFDVSENEADAIDINDTRFALDLKQKEVEIGMQHSRTSRLCDTNSGLLIDRVVANRLRRPFEMYSFGPAATTTVGSTSPPPPPSPWPPLPPPPPTHPPPGGFDEFAVEELA